jgi:hypothetical protein
MTDFILPCRGRFDVFEDDNDTSPDYRARDRLASTIGPTDRVGASGKDRSGDRGSAVVGPSVSMSRERSDRYCLYCKQRVLLLTPLKFLHYLKDQLP